MEMSTATKQYVWVDVAATKAGLVYNPTADTVQMAFVAAGTTPVSGDFKSAVWDTDAAHGIYSAGCVVGPGGTTTLSAGVYRVWVKVTDSPEIPIQEAGTLVIT